MIDLEAEMPGDLDGLVARHVVDEDDLVDRVVRDVVVRPLQRPGGVVGGHDDDDARRGGVGCRLATSGEGEITGEDYRSSCGSLGSSPTGAEM